MSTPLPLRLPARPALRLVVQGYARREVPDALHRVAAEAPDPSAAWLAALGADGHEREEAVARLHALLLRAARFEVRRRRPALGAIAGPEFDDLATQAAGDALVAILAKLDTFRGESRFTTWAYKFVLLEAAVKCRRRAWQHREVTLDAGDWPATVDRAPSSHARLEHRELLEAVRAAVDGELTPHQRAVFVALALDGVPIDVLAERLDTTRGALYKTLHDARRKLRAAVARAGLDPMGEESP